MLKKLIKQGREVKLNQKGDFNLKNFEEEYNKTGYCNPTKF